MPGSRKIAIMQPYLFPYIGYFQLIQMADTFVIHDDVQYIKAGWINRNRLLLNGVDHLFVFNVKHDSHTLEINKREFSEKINESKKKFCKILELAYQKAPYFEETYEFIIDTINNDIMNVSNAIIYTIQRVCAHLDIQTPLFTSSLLDKDNSLKGQDRVINICKTVKATNYINAIGGQELYSKEIFSKNGIKLNFLKTKPIIYKQYNNEFVPNLSIIDVLMFNSKKQIKELLEEFELI